MQKCLSRVIFYSYGNAWVLRKDLSECLDGFDSSWKVLRMKNPGDILQDITNQGLLRQLTPIECGRDGFASVDGGRQVVNFASNDYLGMAHHPGVQEAFIEGIRIYGAGSMASRHVTGTRGVHAELEELLADMKGAEAALSFSSGYATSVGLIPAIVGKGDMVLLDKLSHASLIDGAKLSGARIATFLHNDMESLEKKLSGFRKESPDATILVVTESVFSMDGDCAPLVEIAEIKDKYGALLVVDEAHGFGIYGSEGAGLASEMGVSRRIDFQMGTLSKAVGLSGGYVACSRQWVDLFVNTSRSIIYSTAPPPALACASMKSLEIIRGSEGAEKRTELRRLCRILAENLDMGNRPFSSISPLIIGENEQAMAVASTLRERGFLAPAIRYPTVPKGTARLRITMTAAHNEEQVRAFCTCLNELRAKTSRI